MKANDETAERLADAGFEPAPVTTLTGARYWRRRDRPDEVLSEDKALALVAESEIDLAARNGSRT